MRNGMKMVPPQADQGKTLKHYGVRGMRWGVKKASSDSDTTSRPPVLSNMTKAQKEIAIVTLGTGAAITAALLAGPAGGMAVSALTKVVQIKTTTNTTETITGPDGNVTVREERS